MNVLIHLLLAWLTAIVPAHTLHHASRSEARVSLCTPTAAEHWLIDNESGGDVHAANGDHFGIGQLTAANRWQYSREVGVAPDSTNRCDQLRLMRAYIHDRYQTTVNAVDWWKGHGWY